jgi:hypothetical protein
MEESSQGLYDGTGSKSPILDFFPRIQNPEAIYRDKGMIMICAVLAESPGRG